jgi:cation diffusion facilitator CzcD-associated flavoprotein CzcO
MSALPPAPQPSYDAIIVGAGIGGICAAYHLKKRFPNKTFAVLEARESIGGTWDLFKYPGFRSDSDMYSFSYSFHPWRSDKVFGTGDEIMAYLRDVTATHDLDKYMIFNQTVEALDYSTAASRWTLKVKNTQHGTVTAVSSQFVFMNTGYYDYEAGYFPEFPGKDSFAGLLVHSQAWTEDIDVKGKRVAVIGSGATAITMIPEIAKTAKLVTMVQRSPTYIAPVKGRNSWVKRATLLAAWMPRFVGRFLVALACVASRWFGIVQGILYYKFTRLYPDAAKRGFIETFPKTRHFAPDHVDEHFTPTYAPWDQRICLCPDADFYKAIRGEQADIVTDSIDQFTPEGIKMASGRVIEADIICVATGLKLKCVGGATVSVDGKVCDVSKTMVYRGVTPAGLPNMFIGFGYTNSSWTLKIELSCRYAMRVLEHMERKQLVAFGATLDGPLESESLMGSLNSSYVQRNEGIMPRQGKAAPWSFNQNYLLDVFALTWRAVDADAEMKFTSDTKKTR